MPLPLTSLDDRRFDELVREARDRLRSHLPELSEIAEGDPLYALTDLFAWLTETVLYRANLIPERQRRAFLNLLQIPLRPALPALGLVSIDAPPRPQLPPPLVAESGLRAGRVSLHTRGDLQPTPLGLRILTKERLDPGLLEELGISSASLREQYGREVTAFRPRSLIPGRDALDLDRSIDRAFYLACVVDPRLGDQADALRQQLAGVVLNIGLAPERDLPAQMQTELSARELRWEIAWQAEPDAATASYLPLELVHDSSLGGRTTGVARIRLPRSAVNLSAQWPADPRLAGLGNRPPEPPADLQPGQVLFWIRLRAADGEAFRLGFMDINGVEVVAQGIVRDYPLGRGTGEPDQTVQLPDTQIDAESLDLRLSEQGRLRRWRRVPHFFAQGPDDRVYRLEPATGLIQFGDGVRGRRPPAGSLIRAAYYRHGGGRSGNLPPGSITELVNGNAGLRVRQGWPTRGGMDAEGVAEAERLIPAELSHRHRAVTREDFETLARDNPVNPVARAETVPGLLPGASIGALRSDVPGVVSVFVLPPARPALAAAPRPTAGLLSDVYRYLDPRKLVGTELYVLSPEFVPVAVAIALRAVDPQTATQTAQAVEQAVLDYLWGLPPGGPGGSGWPLGRELAGDELRAVAARVPGVLAVGGLRLYSRHDAQWREAPTARIELRPYQLPELMSVSAQLTDDAPAPPPPLGPSGDGSLEDGSLPLPAPVIPDLC